MSTGNKRLDYADIRPPGSGVPKDSQVSPLEVFSRLAEVGASVVPGRAAGVRREGMMHILPPDTSLIEATLKARGTVKEAL